MVRKIFNNFLKKYFEIMACPRYAFLHTHLEQGAARNKRPRDAPNDAPKQANNITWNKAKDSFGWMKMVKGVSNGSKGFALAEEAALDMQRFYVVAVEDRVPVRGSLV